VLQVKRSAATSHSAKAADRQFFISVTPQSAYSKTAPGAACIFTTDEFSCSDSLA
jgi:hypothetical protein